MARPLREVTLELDAERLAEKHYGRSFDSRTASTASAMSNHHDERAALDIG
jgi:hypothetical protein